MSANGQCFKACILDVESADAVVDSVCPFIICQSGFDDRTDRPRLLRIHTNSRQRLQSLQSTLCMRSFIRKFGSTTFIHSAGSCTLHSETVSDHCWAQQLNTRWRVQENSFHWNFDTCEKTAVNQCNRSGPSGNIFHVLRGTRLWSRSTNKSCALTDLTCACQQKRASNLLARDWISGYSCTHILVHAQCNSLPPALRCFFFLSAVYS